MYGGTIRFALGKPSRCQTILARSHLAQAKSIIINGIWNLRSGSICHNWGVAHAVASCQKHQSSCLASQLVAWTA